MSHKKLNLDTNGSLRRDIWCCSLEYCEYTDMYLVTKLIVSKDGRLREMCGVYEFVIVGSITPLGSNILKNPLIYIFTSSYYIYIYTYDT